MHGISVLRKTGKNLDQKGRLKMDKMDQTIIISLLSSLVTSQFIIIYRLGTIIRIMRGKDG